MVVYVTNNNWIRILKKTHFAVYAVDKRSDLSEAYSNKPQNRSKLDKILLDGW